MITITRAHYFFTIIIIFLSRFYKLTTFFKVSTVSRVFTELQELTQGLES